MLFRHSGRPLPLVNSLSLSEVVDHGSLGLESVAWSRLFLVLDLRDAMESHSHVSLFALLFHIVEPILE